MLKLSFWLVDESNAPSLAQLTCPSWRLPCTCPCFRWQQSTCLLPSAGICGTPPTLKMIGEGGSSGQGGRKGSEFRGVQNPNWLMSIGDYIYPVLSSILVSMRGIRKKKQPARLEHSNWKPTRQREAPSEIGDTGKKKNTLF